MKEICIVAEPQKWLRPIVLKVPFKQAHIKDKDRGDVGENQQNQKNSQKEEIGLIHREYTTNTPPIKRLLILNPLWPVLVTRIRSHLIIQIHRFHHQHTY